MNLKTLGTALLFAASAGVAASDQPDPQSAQGCAVHVYPADGLHSVGEDFDNVHEFDQDVRHYYDMAGRSLDWLTPARQLELLRASRLPALIGPAAASTTYHAEPVTRRQALEPGPRAASPGCTVEVLIPQIMLERGGLSPRSLRVFGVVRRYESGAQTGSYSGYASAPMDGFQIRSPADAGAATAIVEAAYRGAVETMLRNSTKTKRK